LLRTEIGPALVLKNPIMSASGTFGSGWEGRQLTDLGRLGALVSKTVTVRPRPGNPPPRLVETASGMLNSIGLENRGADHFLAESLPRMKSLGPAVIVNIGGETTAEFVELAERFAAAGVDALEVNLSCPNVQEGRLYFCTVPQLTEEVMREIRGVVPKAIPLFAKLSPNVTNIADIARAAVAGGADGITAINTLIGLAVDWRRRRPILGRAIGGLSGPAIKPVALRMVYEVARAVDVPILGVGGIATAEDVLEFLVAGAAAVQVGTANFVDPARMVRLVGEVAALLEAEGATVRGLVRAMVREQPSTQPQPRSAAEAHRP
jgi:dihydroorotate dehydrogenase (NAD+) catalytic subunit